MNATETDTVRRTVGVIARCKACKIAKRADMNPNSLHPADLAATVALQTAFGPLRPGCTYVFDLRCGCGRRLVVHEVHGKRNPSVKCDGRCTHAKGFDCECACGGKNHASQL